MASPKNSSHFPLLIADAGSSKVDWVFLLDEKEERFQTTGINPFFHDADRVEAILKNEWPGGEFGEKVKSLCFYGAGCSSELHKARVKDGLQRLFPSASIEVEHDLLGAARAVAGNEPASVAILGTGSNACSYDGERILEQSGGLGFVLGDEGSGAHLGKLLLRDHLNGDLPRDLEELFLESYTLTRAGIIDRIHRGNSPSRFLAAFALFLKEHEEHAYVRDLVKGAFAEFIDRHLLRFPCVKEVPLHTVGSVGYYFRDFLAAELERREILPGRSITDVAGGLAAYHRSS